MEVFKHMGKENEPDAYEQVYTRKPHYYIQFQELHPK